MEILIICFSDDVNPTRKNRKSIEKFIEVPKDSLASYESGDV